MILHQPRIEVALTTSGKCWHAPGVVGLADVCIDGDEGGSFLIIRTPTGCLEFNYLFLIGKGPPPAFLSNHGTVRLLQLRIVEKFVEHEGGAS